VTRGLARRLENVSPSASMSALAEVARLRKEGREILSLTVGEPDFPTPPHIIEAAIQALRTGQTGYRPTSGIPVLRDAILEAFSHCGLAFKENEVTIGSGAKQLIFAAFLATVDVGDEIIVPTPYWVSYPEIGTLFGAKIVNVPCDPEDGFKLLPSRLEAALTNKTRWLVLNSPNNPTGAVYSSEELAGLGKVLERYPDCLILSDEIYQHLIYDNRLFVPFAAANPALLERVLTVNGVSKAYSMTGFRLGYAGGPAWLVAALNTILTHDTTCPSSISQVAAAAALTGNQDTIGVNRAAYQLRRDRLVDQINKIPGMQCSRPSGAFYLFVSVSGLFGARTASGDVLNSDMDIANHFLRIAGVAVLPGSAFGLSSYLRLSFAISMETLNRAAEALSLAVQSLTLQSEVC